MTMETRTSVPTMSIVGGIYSFEWEDEEVKITLERLR